LVSLFGQFVWSVCLVSLFGTQTKEQRCSFISCLNGRAQKMEAHMLGWALTFFVLAIIAALLGFGGIAGAASGIAQFLFVVFLVLLVVTFIVRALRGRSIS
jgi:uncharacterized membrane protein YtjA (UPF0391 family)